MREIISLMLLCALYLVGVFVGYSLGYENAARHIVAESHVSCRPYLTSLGNVYLRVKQTDGTTLALYHCLGPDIPDTVSLEDYPLHEREQHPEKWREHDRP